MIKVFLGGDIRWALDYADKVDPLSQLREDIERSIRKRDRASADRHEAASEPCEPPEYPGHREDR